jgi:RHS repeat-associated protein
MRFAGKHLDPETALHYFEARYYRQTWGRFSQVDPVNVGAAMTDPQQWNRYAYARNNPLAYRDPTGMTVENGGWTHTDTGWCHNSGIYCEFRPIEWWESPGFDATVGYGFGSDPGVIEGFGSGGAGGFFALMDQARQQAQEQTATVTTSEKINTVQTILNAASIAASASVVGEPAAVVLDLTSAVISGFTGDWWGAGLAAASAAPWIGTSANFTRLGKQMASEAGMEQLLKGGGRVFAGAGTDTPIKDIERLIASYGGTSDDWVKVTSTNPGLQSHAYRNKATGQTVEVKSKLW